MPLSLGRPIVGRQCVQQDDVLSLDLEKGRSRIKRRLRDTLVDCAGDARTRLTFMQKARQFDQGSNGELKAWRLKTTGALLIVIDVLQRVPSTSVFLPPNFGHCSPAPSGYS